MDADSEKKLTDAIDRAWDNRPAGAVFNSVQMACSIMTAMALANPAEWMSIRDQLAQESISTAIERRIVHALRKSDMRQGWLALDEYQHVPHFIKVEGGLLDVNQATLDQYRETEEEVRLRIKNYAYPRRSAEKLKRDKQMLSEMRKVDRRVSPIMANAPEMKMGEAIRRHMESPAVQQRRKAGKASGKARKGSTKNQ